MAIKVRDPRRWRRMPADEAIAFGAAGRRNVKLEMNVPTECQVHAVYPDDGVVFLASFKGMETIEFVADGALEIWVTSDGTEVHKEVWFYADDGHDLSFPDVGEASFVKMHSRRSQSEQIIHMQQLAMANMERNMAALEAINAQLWEQANAQDQDGGGTGEGAIPDGEGEASGSAASDASGEGMAGAGA